MVICLERGASDLHNGSADATVTPSSPLQQNPECFILLIPAQSGSLGLFRIKGRKTVVVGLVVVVVVVHCVSQKDP